MMHEPGVRMLRVPLNEREIKALLFCANTWIDIANDPRTQDGRPVALVTAAMTLETALMTGRIEA